MSWIKTATTSALAAGAILLSAGCTSKKDVAIAAKDETIRRQESQIASSESERAAADNQARMAAEQARIAAEQARASTEQANRAAAINQQLAAQNTAVVEHSAVRIQEQTLVINQQTARLGQMQNEMVAMESKLNGPTKTIVVTQPGQTINHERGEVGNFSKHPDNSIHIQVAGSVLFEAGHAELKPGCSDTLMRICQTIRSQYPNHAIRIEGHTDSSPVVHSKDKYPDNMALSQARAQSVYDFMANRGGLQSGKMYTAGYGDRQPLVQPERTAADRAKNRRVEIVILPNNLNVQKDKLAAGGDQARPYKTAVTNPAAKKGE